MSCSSSASTRRLRVSPTFFRRPALLLRSILAMNVVMPVLAIVACLALQPAQAIAIALVGLAISPVPPFLPTQQLGAGGPSRYVFGLLVAAALASIVLVPASIALIDRVFGRNVEIPVSKVATIMLMTVLAPLVAGVVVRRFAPAFAERIARPVSIVGNVLLIAAVIPLLVVVTTAVLAAGRQRRDRRARRVHADRPRGRSRVWRAGCGPARGARAGDRIAPSRHRARHREHQLSGADRRHRRRDLSPAHRRAGGVAVRDLAQNACACAKALPHPLLFRWPETVEVRHHPDPLRYREKDALQRTRYLLQDSPTQWS